MLQHSIVISRNFLFLILSAFLFSCKSEKKQDPVSIKEAKEFAIQLQSSIEKREAGFYNNAIDKAYFLKKAGLKDAGDKGKAFGEGIAGKLNIGTQLVNSLSKKGLYQLVKQYEKENKQHLIFRLYDNGSLNYHDIELIKKGAEVKISDLFVYTSGELLSETIHNLYQQMMKLMDKPNSEDEEWLNKLPAMRVKMNKGDYEGALQDYESLPEKIKKLRAIALMRIMITSGLADEAQYSAAIEAYQQQFPNEPNMHLVLIDGYIMKKEYDNAFQAVNKLDSMINKDPFLDYYRYLLSNLKKDNASSVNYLSRFVKNFPDFEDGILEFILTYREVNETSKADSLIKEYRLHSGFDQARLERELQRN